METDSRVEVARCYRSWRVSFPGYRVSVWDDEKVLKIILVMVAQQCDCALCY